LIGSGLSRISRAEIYLVETDTVQFTLGGYVQSLMGYQRSSFDTQGLIPQEMALNSAITRFEWELNVGEHVGLLIHDRFFWQLQSENMQTSGGLVGLGVTRPPDAHIDLESILLQDPDGLYLLTHDFDRLALRLYFDAVDITIGRQAITWGNTLLFPISDLWAQFSPYELDTSQKPGVDAIRAISPITDRVELDFIFADKGDVSDLSAGVRSQLYLERADVYFAFAKIWNELFLFGGVSADLQTFTLRLDAALPFNLDDTELELPRATVAIDYFATDLFLSVELYFNGLGAADHNQYPEKISSVELARGETYYIGRYYFGSACTYNLTELFKIGMSVLFNLQDPSVVLLPSLTYQLAASVDVSLGAYVPVGEDPDIAVPLVVNSEYGLYPYFVYLQVAAFF